MALFSEHRTATIPDIAGILLGAHRRWVEPDLRGPANELVIVSRWIRGNAFRDVVALVVEAMGDAAVHD